MRITNQMMINNAIQHMTDNLDRLNTLSERTSTGKQFQNASDDPVSASLSLSLRSTLNTTGVYKSTADLADDWMTANDSALKQLVKMGTNAQNLALRGLNDTMGADERLSALSKEMDQIIQQALDAANTSHQGQYLFSGYQTDKAPFVLSDPAVTDPTQPNPDWNKLLSTGMLSYQGDAKTMLRAIGPGQTVDVNVLGGTQIQPFLESLIKVRNALFSNDTTALRTELGGLQSSMETINEARTTNGARQRQVQTAAEYLDKIQVDVKGLLSKKEDVNMAESISLLRGQETTYQSVLEVSQRAISALNLFDYLK